MQRVLITGTSSGIGKATALKFLEEGFYVVGMDILPTAIEHKNYEHIIHDVSDANLPELEPFDYVINNAATIEEERAIAVNLVGYYNIAEKYAFNKRVIAVTNVGSISGVAGLDLPLYSASQGGRRSYTMNLARRLCDYNKVRCNLVSFGATMTGLEPYLYEHEELVDMIAGASMLGKWMKPEEGAEWLYFVTVVNKSMQNQEIVVDNGETRNYRWYSLDDLQR